MYVHPTAKLCFLAHPRTASRSVRDALTRVGFKEVGAHHDGPDQGHSVDGYQVFTVVRNHWDAVVSWWYNARMDAKEVLPSIHWIATWFSKNRYYFRAGQMYWFRSVPGVITLRYESLADELNRLLSVYKLPRVELPHEGRSLTRDRRHYSTFYDSETRQFVEWCFLREIEALGYRFEEIPSWMR